jgi:glutathione S-transferase
MIRVHHLRHSRSQRIPWLLEELGVAYEIVAYERRGGLAPASLKSVHPLGKAPVIEDDDRVLAESGAIIEYLVERHGDGSLAAPEQGQGRREWTYWMHYAEGSLMPLVVMDMVLDRMQRVPWPLRPLAGVLVNRVRGSYLEPGLETHLRWVEDALEHRDWFAGDVFSAADIQMSLPLEALQRRPRQTEPTPRITAFLDRVRSRPAYRRAQARLREAESRP